MWGDLRRFQGRPQSPWWSPRRAGKQNCPSRAQTVSLINAFPFSKRKNLPPLPKRGNVSLSLLRLLERKNAFLTKGSRKERRARGWLRRSHEKAKPRTACLFRETRLCPRTPAVRSRRFRRKTVTALTDGCSTAGIRSFAEPSAVLNGCVVGIRRPNAGGKERENVGTPGSLQNPRKIAVENRYSSAKWEKYQKI